MGRPRTFDEDEVVAAAKQQFWATGYHGTSVGDLSKATGLGKGSLYGAFGDKHQLFMRIFDEYCEASDRSAAAMVEGPADEALDRARAWLVAGAEGSGSRGCLLARGAAELSSEDPEVAGRAHDAFTTLLDACVALVEQAQRAGQVDPAADAHALGGLILATHRGIEALGKAGIETDTLRGIAHAAVDSIAVA